MLDNYFNKTSPLGEHLSSFAPREGQTILAKAIAKAMQNSSVLVAEAGTGIGKTFAYLFPSVLRGKKIIISTATKHLQDQIFHKDLPLVLRALNVAPKVSILKGRANYLCQHRLSTYLKSEMPLTNSQRNLLRDLSRFSQISSTGDLTEFMDAETESLPLHMFTSNADNCLGGECDYIQQCFITKARRKAMEAEIIIVNHHLLLANLLLQQDGLGELLPEADTIIVDEAHQLLEVAHDFFGVYFSSRQLLDLLRDIETEYFAIAGDVPQLPLLLKRFEKISHDFRIVLGESSQRRAWQEIQNKPELQNLHSEMQQIFAALHQVLASLAERAKGLENCYQRCEALLSAFQKTTQLDGIDDALLWYETYQQSFILRQTPLTIAKQFREYIEQKPSAWIFTSATISANESFTYFTEQLGLQEATTLRVESPFDYAEQSLLYVPQHLPEPNSKLFFEKMIAAIRPVLEASKGRAFILFTSHRALNEAVRILQDLPYPLLVQGQAPKQQLLEQFRSLGNAVLLGTSSFWEGVDIAGEALSLVVIDRIPFASPDDPVRQARFNLLKQQGKDPFVIYQLPQAILALKQGAGRLIRDVSDRGVLMICDVRLADKWYRKYFLRSLPPMRRTRDLNEVLRFYE